MRLANRVLFKMFARLVLIMRRKSGISAWFLEKMLRRMRTMHCCTEAWVTWEDHASEMRHQQNVLEKMAIRMKNTLVYKSLSTWQQNAGDVRQQRSVLVKMALRMRNACSFKAFLSWSDHAAHIRLLRRCLCLGSRAGLSPSACIVSLPKSCDSGSSVLWLVRGLGGKKTPGSKQSSEELVAKS